MSGFLAVLGKLSEHGIVKIAGYTILGYLGAEGIACLAGYDLEISRNGIRCHKRDSDGDAKKTVPLTVYRNEASA